MIQLNSAKVEKLLVYIIFTIRIANWVIFILVGKTLHKLSVHSFCPLTYWSLEVFLKKDVFLWYKYEICIYLI